MSRHKGPRKKQGLRRQAASKSKPTTRSNRRPLTPATYIEGILQSDRTILARAITLIESNRAEDADPAQEVIEGCLPHSGHSVRVGITGAPGVGKSTFLEALGTHLTHERGEKVAVLTVDPSSQVSGGSILGDKTRMPKLAADERAFIRPSPSGGSLGGVARRTREAMLLCEAAGYGNVFVETVGTGQSETAVASMVDFFLLLLLPGAGDELQGIKRGVIEMADLLAVNKADGANQTKAGRAREQYHSALHLFAPKPSGWTPQAVTCSAKTGQGIPEIWEIVLEHRREMTQTGWLEHVRREQAKHWMNEVIEEELRQHFRRDPGIHDLLPEYEAKVTAGETNPAYAARELLAIYRDKKKR